VRTPIVLHWPGVIRAEQREVPVSSVDIPATILAACGIEVPETWPGHDLRLARSEGEHARGPVFGAAYTHDVVDLDDPARSLVTRFVVDGEWKLLAHEDSSEGTAGFELFHLTEDPAESRPVEEPERRAALLALLDGWWRLQ
jgi:uncharacterized sulfatase